MRKAINDNPIAQAAMVGALLLVGALFVLGGMGKKSSEPSAAAPVPGATPGDPAAPAVDPAGGGPTAAVPATEVPSTGVPVAGVPVVAGPRLPPAVNAAYSDGKTIVLVVTRGGGIDDRLLRRSVVRLHSVPGVAVFATRARGVARYARITQAVQLDRVPALVVVSPRDMSAGGTPTAEVQYGFQSAASVVQTVRDILYRGPTVGYSPD